MNKSEYKDTDKEKLFQLIEIIANRQNIMVDNISLSTNFKDDLGIDSLEIVEIIIDTERMFNISITPEEQKGIETINDLFNLIEEHDM